MVCVQLVRLDVGFLGDNLPRVIVFFSDDRGSGVEFLQIVGDRVLDVNICFSKDVGATSS